MNQCKSGYFTQVEQAVPLIDVVLAEYDPGTQKLTATFPYPFQLLGVADVTDWVYPPPFSEFPMTKLFEPSVVANQMALRLAFLEMFTIMMYANRDKGKYASSPFLGSIVYDEAGMGNYDNYFYDKENANAKEIFYRQFLANPSLIYRFWDDENTIASPTTMVARLLVLCQDMYNVSDRRLWGSPGKYTMNFTPESISGELELQTFLCPLP